LSVLEGRTQIESLKEREPMPWVRPINGKHTVIAGEWASSIAHVYGIEDWKVAVWEDGENAALNAKRDPFVLAPKDVVFIPVVGEKKEPAATTKVHTYKLVEETDIFRVRLMSEEDEPLDSIDVSYSVETSTSNSDWLGETGHTDGDGFLEFECPRTATAIKLHFLVVDDTHGNVEYRVELQPGNLRPMHNDDVEKTRMMGVQGRLHGLGFTPGPLDGLIGPLTRAALKSFQMATQDKAYRATYGIDAAVKVTGTINDATILALKKAYGA